MSAPINVAVLGPESAGKSSICGALLVSVPPLGEERGPDATYRRRSRWTEEIFQHLQAEAGRYGRQSSWLAWVMDRRRSEREMGTTFDGNIAKIETPQRVITLLDTPGREKHWQKAVTFLCQADAALVVIPAELAKSNEISSNAQLLRSLATLFVFRKRDLIVVVSQMDKVDYDEKVFHQAETAVRSMLRRIGFSQAAAENIPVLPVSVLQGCGVTANVSADAEEGNRHPGFGLAPWFRGPSLVQALESLADSPPHEEGSPLLIFSKAYRIRGVGTVVCACVLRGEVRSGDVLMLVPGCIKVKVRTLHFFQKKVACAVPGMQIGLSLETSGTLHLHDLRSNCLLLVGRTPGTAEMGVSSVLGLANREDLHRAQQEAQRAYNLGVFATRDIHIRTNTSRMSLQGPDADFLIPSSSRRIVVDVRIVRDALGKQKRPLKNGSPLLLHCFLQSARIRVNRVIATLDREFRVDQMVFNPEVCASKGQILRMELESSTDAPILVEPDASFAPLARIILCDTQGIIAAGVVRQSRPLPPLRILLFNLRSLPDSVKHTLETYYQVLITNFTSGSDINNMFDGVHLVLIDLCSQHRQPQDLAMPMLKGALLEELQKFIARGGSLLGNLDAGSGSRFLLSQLGLSATHCLTAGGRSMRSQVPPVPIVPARVEVRQALRRVVEKHDKAQPRSFQQWTRSQHQQAHSSTTQTHKKVSTATRLGHPSRSMGRQQPMNFKPCNRTSATDGTKSNTLSGAKLSARGLRIALEFAASPAALSAVQATCRAWQLAADDTPWHIACVEERAEECPVSHLRWLSDEAREQLLSWAPRSPWKACMALYRSAVSSCAVLVDGTHGRVSHVIGPFQACFHAVENNDLGKHFVPVCVLGHRFGKGSVVMHLPRYAAGQHQRGQVLITSLMPRDITTLLLNFAAESARQSAECF